MLFLVLLVGTAVAASALPDLKNNPDDILKTAMNVALAEHQDETQEHAASGHLKMMKVATPILSQLAENNITVGAKTVTEILKTIQVLMPMVESRAENVKKEVANKLWKKVLFALRKPVETALQYVEDVENNVVDAHVRRAVQRQVEANVVDVLKVVAPVIDAVAEQAKVEIEDGFWSSIGNFFVDVGHFVEHKIIEPVVHAVVDVAEFVVEDVIEPVANAVVDVAEFVVEDVIEPVVDVVIHPEELLQNGLIGTAAGILGHAIEDGGKLIGNDIIAPVVDAVKDAGEIVVEDIKKPVDNAVAGAAGILVGDVVIPVVGAVVDELI